MITELVSVITAYPKETIVSAAIIGGSYIPPLLTSRGFLMRKNAVEGTL